MHLIIACTSLLGFCESYRLLRSFYVLVTLFMMNQALFKLFVFNQIKFW